MHKNLSRRLLAGFALTALTSLTALAQTVVSPAPAAIDPLTAQPAAPTMPTVGTSKPLPVAEHYPGGQQAMYTFVAQNLAYPAMARRNRIQGQCIIDFTLNDDGSISNAVVVKNAGAGCGEEALRVVKLLKFKGPGYSSKYSIPVMFKL